MRISNTAGIDWQVWLHPEPVRWAMDGEYLPGDPPDGGMWAVPFPPTDAVTHQGTRHPAYVEAIWRKGVVQIHLAIRVDADAGPYPTAVTISATDQSSVAGVHRQPVPSLVATSMLLYADPTVPLKMPGRSGEARMVRLRRIADLYRDAVASGMRVTERIEAVEVVSRKHAYGLIQDARREGLLPPGRPGRRQRDDAPQ